MKKIELNDEKLREAYLVENLTLPQMAERFGCSVSVIQRNLKKIGATKIDESNISRRQGQHKGAAFSCKEELEELYINQNLSANEIAEMKGITKEGVRKYIKKWGLVKDQKDITLIQRSRMKAKYGVDNAMYIDSAKNKVLKAMFERNSEKAQWAYSSAENLKKTIEEIEPKTVVALIEYIDSSESVALRYLHKYDLYSMIDNSSSNGEWEVISFLRGLGIRCEKTRKIIPPYELDIYCPDYKIAIEFNGDYWHSEKKHEQNYHQKKSQMAEEKGVFLYHIFEYEWKSPTKQALIKNQLLNLFNLNQRKIYARECEVKEVSSFDKSAFLGKNHVQGDDHSIIRYGLYFEGELVSLMTFCKPRFLKKSYCDWELSRFCSLAGVNVVGGAGKLFKYFIEHNEGSVISYSDVAKTRGTLYQKLGFKFSHQSKPNYVWMRRGEVLTRYQTQMKNEIEAMTSKGYYRIFDCGSKVWVYER